MQQLETCNDIETAIIAAARAAAAAASSRSASCSRSNSLEQPPATQMAAAKTKSRPALYTTYGNADNAAAHDHNNDDDDDDNDDDDHDDDDDEEEQLHELSFMSDLKSDFVATAPLPLMPTPPTRQSLMSNTELIVDYISSCKSTRRNERTKCIYLYKLHVLAAPLLFDALSITISITIYLYLNMISLNSGEIFNSVTTFVTHTTCSRTQQVN